MKSSLRGSILSYNLACVSECFCVFLFVYVFGLYLNESNRKVLRDKALLSVTMQANSGMICYICMRTDAISKDENNHGVSSADQRQMFR